MPTAAEDSARPDILARYQAAEVVLDKNVATLVLNESIAPNWVGRAAFWYRRQRPNGAEYIWVENGAAGPAFDHSAAAAALGAATGSAIESRDLMVEAIAADGELILRSGDHRWRLANGKAMDVGPVEVPRPGVLVSPNGDQGLVAREHNLYLCDLGAGAERRLTDDGEDNFSWGQYPDAGLRAVVRRRSGLPFAPFGWSWSPDGAFLIGGRVDERHLEPYPFLESVRQDGAVRPRAYFIRQPLVGEPGPIFAACAIEVATGRKIPIDLPEGISKNEMSQIEPLDWSDDYRRAFVAAAVNSEHKATLLEIDLTTGSVRTLITEQSEGFLQLGSEIYKQFSIRMLADGRQAIWYSDRSGFGHLYRYDLATGELMNPITGGPWLVRDILKVDEGQGRVYFTASGREGGDPYQRRVYRVDLDGKNLTLLSPEAADHSLEGAATSLLARLYGMHIPSSAISPDGTVFVDTWSTVSKPGVSVLRSTEDGAIVLPLETADASALYATGWRSPEPFVAKAADGVTDLYGVLYRPHHATGETTPIIDGMYGGPQVTVTPRNFRAARFGLGGQGRAALAALGFAVVVVDGRGTPLRSKAFHNAGYDAFADTCVDDHVAVLHQLCDRDPTLDRERVGVYGHSFGGCTSARAMLRYPDLYKVAVSSAGSHNLHGLYSSMTWAAPPPDYGKGQRTKPDSKAAPQNYRQFDNAVLAANLRGKLMLAYGDMDENVYPAVTLQLCDALNRANRSYDLLYFPNGTHGFTGEPYFMRRLWDYFVEHLMGEQPPLNYSIRGAGGIGGLG
ncbi:MAG: alpha/beta fold hydrolase [Acetobacteraceae bacterium]